MTVALLAVHPMVRDVVFSPSALRDIGRTVELRDISADLASGRWPEHPDAEFVITGWGTPRIDGEALTSMARLTTVFHAAGSVREVTSEELWDRGIQVVSAADANNESVADFVLAQIVLSLKGSHRARAVMRVEKRLPGFRAGPGSMRQVVGLVSFGSIARKVRERLARFDADVVVWDPYVRDADLASCRVRRAASLEELFAESAVVSVHTPLVGATEHLITGDLLALLRPGAVFLNTSRGAVVDEAALVSVLRARPDVLAVLDVTWPEPPVPESLLFDLANVVLTGHSAGSVGTENQRMGDLVRDEVLAFAGAKPLKHTVTRDEAPLRA
ncbi:hydroxyacid dehydrogenase [Streptomyces sp. BH105]|uniref:hydroxyacid dehydrogenase n=1 Tax=Streptomyces sp. BH105 TaxID=3410408 RepID=UPI003CEC66B2